MKNTIEPLLFKVWTILVANSFLWALHDYLPITLLICYGLISIIFVFINSLIYFYEMLEEQR